MPAGARDIRTTERHTGGAVDALRQSLSLLSQRERRVVVVAGVTQTATAVLDLGGVLLIGVVAALAVATVTGGSLPSIVKKLIDDSPMSSVPLATITLSAAALAAGLLIAKSLLGIFLTRWIFKFLARVQAHLAGLLAEGMLNRPLTFLQSRTSQEAAFALNRGVNAATIGILGQGLLATAEVSLLAILALGLLLIDPRVTVFATAYFALVALVLQRLMAGWATRIGVTGTQSDIASTELIQEAYASYREMTVAGRRANYAERFRGLRWKTASIQADLSFLATMPKYVFEIALVVGASILALTQFLTNDAAAAVGTIAVFLTAGSRVVPSMLRLQAAVLAIRSSVGVAQPAFDLARSLAVDSGDSSALLVTDSESGDQSEFRPTIELRDVWFTYPEGDVPALSGISLNVSRGTSVALVGTSGSGKSTLADLMLGVLHPDRGVVSVSGTSAPEAIRRWPGRVAYVPQTVAVSNSSIRQNVALGLAEASIDDDLVWQSLDLARLASDVLEMGGLGAAAGEGGLRLSGGQRQRLGLARAFYGQPELLVLDEATSALDAETEEAIVRELQQIEKSMTVVTVAHRLSTVRHAEVVVCLDRGQLLALGTFEEVRAAVPSFQRQARLSGL